MKNGTLSGYVCLKNHSTASFLFSPLLCHTVLFNVKTVWLKISSFLIFLDNIKKNNISYNSKFGSVITLFLNKYMLYVFSLY